MTFRVGDVCRVNESYLFSRFEGSVVGSIVQVTSVTPPKFTHLYATVYAQMLFSAVPCTDQAYMFYANELELITQEPSND